MRELLAAARKLAGCTHPEDGRFTISLHLPSAPGPVVAFWCQGCGTIFETRPLGVAVLAEPSLVDQVTSEANEVDTHAANVAHAEAHAPGALRHAYIAAREEVMRAQDVYQHLGEWDTKHFRGLDAAVNAADERFQAAIDAYTKAARALTNEENEGNG